MVGKKTRQMAGEPKSRLTGIAGIGNSVGCTHFSIMLLNYLSGFMRKRSALLEFNDTGALERLEKVAKARF